MLLTLGTRLNTIPFWNALEPPISVRSPALIKFGYIS